MLCHSTNFELSRCYAILGDINDMIFDKDFFYFSNSFTLLIKIEKLVPNIFIWANSPSLYTPCSRIADRRETSFQCVRVLSHFTWVRKARCCRMYMSTLILLICAKFSSFSLDKNVDAWRFWARALSLTISLKILLAASNLNYSAR